MQKHFVWIMVGVFAVAFAGPHSSVLGGHASRCCNPRPCCAPARVTCCRPAPTCCTPAPTCCRPLPTCAGGGKTAPSVPTDEKPPAPKTDDIVDTAVGAGSFKTLVTAVKAADLVSTLKGKGPFTVFAPTDAAFSKLPKGTVESLLKPENKKKLQAILTYHVVAASVLAKDVVKLTSAKTVNGKSVKIEVKDGKVYVDGAQVVKTDIECSNGVIHVIDKVILP